ncbi:MAG TPA: hypothetical protein VJ299_17555, partial [Steroidobacteraceae bacterium]|nr:hypothetical protein [Steroidobacteraceae bacterium]
AHRAKVVLCPGVGFDVVPTDSIAAKLKQALPDATHLTLGFEGNSGMSKGTAKTSVESVGGGSRVRREGKIVPVELGSQTRRIDFGAGERLAVGIPWGDVSTAYFTTGIPNIEVFTAISQKGLDGMRRANWIAPLLRQRWMQAIAKRVIDARLRPPDRTQRENNPSFIWGEARNAAGRTKTARLRTANGYSLTVASSLGILGTLLAQPRMSGFATPSELVGPDFVTTLPGSSPIRIDS